jgi:hypothetical protein
MGRTIGAMRERGRAGVADSAGAPRLRRELQATVDEIARRQRADGGIGYWARDGWTTPSLSAQAGLLLLDARDLGIVVDPAVVAALGAYLERAAQDPRAAVDTTYGTRAQRAALAARRLGARLASLHFARRAGMPRRSEEDALVAQAGRLTWEDRVWLAALLAGRRDAAGRARAQALLAAAWRPLGTVGSRVEIPDSLMRQYGFPSRMRPAARLLEATLAIAPAHPRLGALVEHLVLRARSRRDWIWNTQDIATSASALAEVARLQRGAPSRVRVQAGPGGTALVGATAATSVRGDSVQVTLDGLLVADGAAGDSVALPIVVESDGPPAFFVLTVSEVPRERPVTPDVRGLDVERWYERYADGKPVTEVRAGELVRVQLRVTAPADRDFVALEDALPAGLEAVDASLRGSAAQLTGAPEPPATRGDDDIEVDDGGWYGRWGGWWSPWEHSELRDDRVLFFARTLARGTYRASYVARATTAGRYVRPPARAEEMYDPASSGRSDGGWFTVRGEAASASGSR